jgi:hypothetical protein
VQSFSTFYGSQVENHAHWNAEFVRGRDAAAGLRGSRSYVHDLAKRAGRTGRRTSRPYEDAFAALLLIKHPIGLLRFGEPPAVGEQVLDRNFSIGDEACAFGLPDL